jgi:hypothetical protein
LSISASVRLSSWSKSTLLSLSLAFVGLGEFLSSYRFLRFAKTSYRDVFPDLSFSLNGFTESRADSKSTGQASAWKSFCHLSSAYARAESFPGAPASRLSIGRPLPFRASRPRRSCVCLWLSLAPDFGSASSIAASF